MAAENPHPNAGATLESSPERIFLITPDDDNDLAMITTAISFVEEGTLTVITKGGDTVTIPEGALAPGCQHLMRVKRVLETGTTVTGLVGYC